MVKLFCRIEAILIYKGDTPMSKKRKNNEIDNIDNSEVTGIWDEVDQTIAESEDTAAMENEILDTVEDTEEDLSTAQEYLSNFEADDNTNSNFDNSEQVSETNTFDEANTESDIVTDTDTVLASSISDDSEISDNETGIVAEEPGTSDTPESQNASKKKKKVKMTKEEKEAAKILKNKGKKRIRIFNIATKLTLISIIPLIVLCIVTTLASTSVLRRNLESEIQGSLKIVAVSLQQTYSSLYEGDYHSGKGGALYKGETKISKDTSLVDALRDETGCDSTFYYDRRSVVTSLMRSAGGRNVGHLIDKELYDRILAGEDVFLTDYELDGTNYYAYFLPLVNEDGSIPGCIYACKPSEEVKAAINKETHKIMIYSILLSVACMGIILFFSNSLSRNMKKTKKFLEIVSTGDLTQNANLKSLKRNDELGDMYSMSYALQENLKHIVTDIKSSANELTNSGDHLMDISTGTTTNVDTLCESIEFISKGASDQAEQTGRAAEQASNIGDQIDDIAKQIESLSGLATNMAEVEKSSSSIIRDLDESNLEVINSIEQIAKQIEVTNTSIQSIQSAVSMIKAITDETDLLSINASIEAAHAGDAGRGFAVVAEQISKLASQSGDNAAEIEKTINTLLKESALMVTYMDDVKVKIADQKEKLNLTIEGFSEVANGVDASLKNINKISSRMGELRKSRDVILDIINDLSAVSEQYSASTANTISSAQDVTQAMVVLGDASTKLKQMADALYSELEVFILEANENA